MKLCPRCQEMKDETAFGKNRSRKDGLQAQCRQCVKVTQHNWYVRNQETHYTNVKRRRDVIASEVISKLIAYLRVHPCVDCGEDDPLFLEFDHVHGPKRLSISNMYGQGYGWATILAEIEKCEVRCVKCHRRRTAKQFGHRRALLMGLSE